MRSIAQNPVLAPQDVGPLCASKHPQVRRWSCPVKCGSVPQAVLSRRDFPPKAPVHPLTPTPVFLLCCGLCMLLACGGSDKDKPPLKPVGPTMPEDRVFEGPQKIGNPCDPTTQAERCPSGQVCDQAQTGGYCRPAGPCQAQACAAAGGACATIDTQPKCWGLCDGSPRGERASYQCEQTEAGTLFVDKAEWARTITADDMLALLSPNCSPKRAEDGAYEFIYTIDQDTVGYQLISYSMDSNLFLSPTVLPNGDILDYGGPYIYHNAGGIFPPLESRGVGTFGSVVHAWAIGVPLAPQFDSLLQPGQHTHRITPETAGAGEPCIAVVQRKRDAGTTLHLNFYFATARNDLDAKSAPYDGDMQRVLELVDERFAQAGISLGTIHYFGLPQEVVERYQIVRTEEDLYELVAHGRPLSKQGRENLSVDVFLVDDIVLTEEDIIGISGGLPGQAGFHGMHGNGLIFKANGFGLDNDYMANLITHELGHYLGLRHTTEFFHKTEEGKELEGLIGSTDPMRDTPVCEILAEAISRSQLQKRCGDYPNIMFPLIPPARQQALPQFTPEQAATLKTNPLIH